ncbi:unnamed protein product [Kuraishia capsulata CBS 1993]|uniref:alpha,alpha-trehalase n=1 Tax=Kuraishia capsulata CBS 1993 TaxID=1382522 RepID=W6MPK2_9ASCO|nr:uncharacterized protein KUCA_T00004623001 [Kuraishia capsulata CBS 1993]CDK28639.1 unnamed protein product [Kuraishia capsulata CBS 1993]
MLSLLLLLSAVSATLLDDHSYYDASNRVAGTDLYNKYNHFANQPYVANGYIGSRIPNLGQGFTYDQAANTSSALLDNGWPLFDKRYAGSFAAGFYDLQPNTTGTNFPELEKLGYESVISSIPEWTTLLLQLNYTDSDGAFHSATLDPQLTNTTKVGSISDYYQELSFNKGTVTTGFFWEKLVYVTITVFAHRFLPTLGVVNIALEFNNSTEVSNVTLSATDILDFSTSQRTWLEDIGSTEDGIYIVVNPLNIDYKSATVFSRLVYDDVANAFDVHNSSTSVSATAVFDVQLDSESFEQLNITKFAGVVSSDYLNDNSTDDPFTPFDKAQGIAYNSSEVGYDIIYSLHLEAWSDLWGDSRISVPSDATLTLAAEASIYHLLANTRSGASGVTSALAVSGLSSDSYGGMVFWDTDLWMLPALIPFSPEHAVAVSKFRHETHPQAIRNAESRGFDGAAYSWTSGRFGNCTSTGPCFDYEYHINVAVSLSVWKLFLAGAIDDDYLAEYGYPIIRDAADFFASYVEFNDTLGAYTTNNLTDPDEYANFKNNGAYTNAGISQVMKWASLIGEYLDTNDTNADWLDIEQNMYLPVSDYNVTLEYSGMNSSVEIKQADVVLITYPLDDNDHAFVQDLDYDKDRAVLDMTYYSEHQSSQGPAMTFPVFSAVAAKLNDFGCGSQTYLLKSIEPFLRLPFGQMSEQNNDDYYTNGGTHPAFPFLTGHGGVLQGFVFGLTGLSFGYRANGSDFERLLNFDPVALPLFPGGISIEGIQYNGQVLDVIIDDDEATLVHRAGKKSVSVYVDSRNPQGGVTYTLHPDANLTLPLFFPNENFAGSITECRASVVAVSASLDGDVPESLIDGDNSTTWQASLKNETAAVLLDLGSIYQVSSGIIVWGDRLAKSVSLSAVPETLARRYLQGSLAQNATAFEAKAEAREIVSELKIKPSYNATGIRDPYDVQVGTANFTLFDLEKPSHVRYVLFEVDGVYDESDDTTGAVIAEISLF